MALKADRHEFQTDISFFLDDAASTRGGVVVHDGTTASGAAMDQGVNKVKYSTTANTPASTEIPVGILLNDVVNKDLTRTHLNHFKDEVQLGGKVTILRKGWVVTSNILGTPAAGDVAYMHVGGAIGNGAYPQDHASSGNHVIGRFLTRKDEDGYCKVEVNLPNFGYALD